MGRESKIYFVKEYQIDENTSYGLVLATYDADNLGHSEEADAFRNCFDTETKFPIETNTWNEEIGKYIVTSTYTDSWDNRICYASDNIKLLKAVIDLWNLDKNWPVLNELKVLIDLFSRRKDIRIVHYGY